MKKSMWEGGEGQIHLFVWWLGRGRINSSSMFLLERGGEERREYFFPGQLWQLFLTLIQIFVRRTVKQKVNEKTKNCRVEMINLHKTIHYRDLRPLVFFITG